MPVEDISIRRNATLFKIDIIIGFTYAVMFIVLPNWELFNG